MTRLATGSIRRVLLRGTHSLRFASFRRASLLRLPARCRPGTRLTPRSGGLPQNTPSLLLDLNVSCHARFHGLFALSLLRVLPNFDRLIPLDKPSALIGDTQLSIR